MDGRPNDPVVWPHSSLLSYFSARGCRNAYGPRVQQSSVTHKSDKVKVEWVKVFVFTILVDRTVNRGRCTISYTSCADGRVVITVTNSLSLSLSLSLHTHIHTQTHTRTHIHTYIHTNIHIYIHTNKHTYYIHTSIHTYIHTYIHTNIHTYIHTYIHITYISSIATFSSLLYWSHATRLSPSTMRWEDRRYVCHLHYTDLPR